MYLALAALVASLAAQAGAPRTSATPPIVSNDWLQQHLSDPNVHVIVTGDLGRYNRAHIPGARFIDHEATVGPDHRLLAPSVLAAALAKAGAADGAHIVLYGDSPMTTGWLFMAFASIGHGDNVSMLEAGIDAWQSEKRAVSTMAPAAATSTFTPKAAPEVIVDAPWMKTRLESPAVRVLDVRTTGEWNGGHLPGATLILWQDLFGNLETQKLKSLDEIRALLARAGVQTGQRVVTYCAVGMRASLMYWAARAVGVPASVYVGSYQDWQRDSSNPIVRGPG